MKCFTVCRAYMDIEAIKCYMKMCRYAAIPNFSIIIIVYFTSLSQCNMNYIAVFQNFRSAVIKALKSFKIDHDNYQQDICEKASNTAEVVWRLITLPDPMLLHLKSTEQLKKDEELFNSEKFKLHSNTKTRIKAKEDDYEIDAYAYPRLTNSCGGKIIEVAIVFVRKRK